MVVCTLVGYGDGVSVVGYHCGERLACRANGIDARGVVTVLVWTVVELWVSIHTSEREAVRGDFACVGEFEHLTGKC